MYRPENWDEIQAITTKRPQEDYYIMKIINATEGRSKNGNEEILRLELDIAEGEFKGFFTKLSQKLNKNLLLRVIQLTQREESLPYFKKMILDIENSNFGYTFDFNPISLREKIVGAYLLSYDYESKYGTKQGLKLDRFYPVGEVREKLGHQLKKNLQKIQDDKIYNDLPFN